MRKEPCVMYAQYVIGWGRNMRHFRGCTSRNERIKATIRFDQGERYVTEVVMSMDNIDIPAQAEMDFSQACDWVIKQIESLGYFVMLVEEMPVINDPTLANR